MTELENAKHSFLDLLVQSLILQINDGSTVNEW